MEKVEKVDFFKKKWKKSGKVEKVEKVEKVDDWTPCIYKRIHYNNSVYTKLHLVTNNHILCTIRAILLFKKA